MLAPDPSHPAGAGLVPDVRKVAVLRCNALGDLLMALPALTALAAAYPGAETTLLGGRWHARFLPGRFAPVHRVQVLPRVEGLVGQPADAPPAAELAGFPAAARAERYDIAVQLHGGGAQSNPVVGALGARVSAGLRADGAPPLDRTVPYRYYQSEQARYLEVIGLLGAPTCPPPVRLAELPADARLAELPADARRAEELLGPGPRRVHCPVCGVDTSTAGFPHRPGEGCAHRPSFLDQIPVVEVLEEVRSLLSAEPSAGGPRLERSVA